MNTKVAIGLIATLIVLVGAYVVLNRPSSPPAFTSDVASTTATSTLPTTSGMNTLGKQTNGAPVTPAKPAVQIVPDVKFLPVVITFDNPDLRTSDSYPVISGKSTSQTVAIIVSNSEHVGLSGTSHIPVVDGHWSFSSPYKLSPGFYNIQVYAGLVVASGTVTVIK